MKIPFFGKKKDSAALNPAVQREENTQRPVELETRKHILAATTQVQSLISQNISAYPNFLKNIREQLELAANADENLEKISKDVAKKAKSQVNKALLEHEIQIDTIAHKLQNQIDNAIQDTIKIEREFGTGGSLDPKNMASVSSLTRTLAKDISRINKILIILESHM